jgi:chemotaxis protein histidine kinase CheA/ActR/RegA family two-component response regulator
MIASYKQYKPGGMNDLNDFDEGELSAEDLEVLRAFDAMDSWDSAPTGPLNGATITQERAAGPSAPQNEEDALAEDVLLLFISEAEDDIAHMRRTLSLLEQDDQIQPSRFTPIKRAAHKIRGTSGAVECLSMSTIAHYAELIVEKMTGGTLFPVIGVNALVYIVTALEATLEQIVKQGKEPQEPLAELENALRDLGIDLREEEEEEEEVQQAVQETEAIKIDELRESERETMPLPLTFVQESTALPIPLLRIDARRVDQLTLHAESLAEQQTALENAQQGVELALQELHTAQTRLQRMEPVLSSTLLESGPLHAAPEPPTSSLTARILHEAARRKRTKQSHEISSHARRAKPSGSATWDELDLERYNERDLLIRSLREAVADMNLASSKVRTAFAHLNRIMNESVAQVSSVRNDILLLRLTPISTLVPRLRQEMTMSALAQQQQIQFEVEGDATEVDQDILEALASPLVQLLRTCIADTAQETSEKQEPYRIWLHASGGGNEISLEIGFSMTVQGGAVEALREPIQRLNGSISLQRNAAGGVSFLLRLPRSHTTSHCLMARVGQERIMVPFSQVQRISDMQRERIDMLYQLHDLLDFPPDTTPPAQLRPVLIMPRSISRKVIGVAVDEIIGEIELVVKPLSPYLQRPGISGAAVDGGGYVLLMVDLPELISHYTLFLRTADPSSRRSPTEKEEQQTRQPNILVADDSVFFRQSLLQMLKHASYSVTEARDGLEALEQLLEHTPDVLLLDIEMPDINGYDVLSVMHTYPELAAVKVVMLTSRSSEKHRRHARELGAHGYLTKPCPQEILLATIEEMLAL